MVSDRVQLCKWIFSLSNNICWKDCPIPIGGSWHICWKSAGHIREDFFVPFILFHRIPKKGNAKECSNYCIIALIPHASKVMLKILQARLQQYVNSELPDVQAGFRKGRGTRDQTANIPGSSKNKRIPEKHLFLLYWVCQNFDCVDHNKLWKILKEMGIPDHLTCLLRNLYAGQEATVRTGHWQWTGSKLAKEYVKAVYCHSAHLTYMQSTSC